jgi:HAD superfamily hydrolase (TIGR01509 family)
VTSGFDRFIVDVDGTLVDSNYHHALAWSRAFCEFGHVISLSRLHRHIGMGGDQFVPAVASERVEADCGAGIRERHDDIFTSEFLDQIKPLPDARDFLEALHRAGRTTVLASSARDVEIDRYLDILDARSIVAAWTTASDVASTKPAPDLVQVALDRAGGAGDAVMIGDTVWDCESAAQAGVPTIGVLTGGISASELREAGAVAVYVGVCELRAELGAPPAVRLS